MSECERIRIPHRKICVGDLRRRISIQNRVLGAPKTGVDIRHTFQELRKPWAAVRTVNGKNIFAGVNLDRVPTHIFYIRYYEGLTAEDWIVYKNERYDILEVENINERDEYYAVYCNNRGDQAKRATSA